MAVFTSHDEAYQAAFDLADANIRIPAIIDARETISASLTAEVERRGVELILGSSVSKTLGKLRIKSLESYTPATGAKRNIKCDALIMSGGWTPSLHLWSHSKGGIKWDTDLAAYVPDVANENTVCVGACLLYTSPSPRDKRQSRMPSSA